MGKKSVAVNIAGQRYVVRSDADETYIRTLAEFVDAQIDEIRDAARIVPTQKLAVLSALNIADELFQERRKREQLKERVREKSKAVLGFLDKEEKKHVQEAN